MAEIADVGALESDVAVREEIGGTCGLTSIEPEV